jgi:hypothetical protein
LSGLAISGDVTRITLESSEEIPTS